MNLKKVEDLLSLFEKSNIKRLVVGDNEMTVTLQKNGYSVQPEPQKPVANNEAAPAILETIKSSKENIIRANGVGFFHPKVSHPDIKNKVKIKKGKVVFSITSMNLDHDQHAEQDCIILEFLVTNGEPVEYGQDVVRVEWV